MEIKFSIFHVHTRRQLERTNGRQRHYSHFQLRQGVSYIQEIWNPSVGDKLECRREATNVKDRYAVAVAYKCHMDDDNDTLDDTTVGHLPRKISGVFSLFLRRGISIKCEITGHIRYSSDLSQGGLEIPCLLILEGSKTETSKIKSRLHL